MDTVRRSIRKQRTVSVREDLIQVQVVTVPQVFTGLEDITVDRTDVVVVVVFESRSDLGFIHVDDGAYIDDRMRLQFVELLQNTFKSRKEILPGIITQVVRAEHEIDPVILLAAQSLIDRDVAVRCSDDRL